MCSLGRLGKYDCIVDELKKVFLRLEVSHCTVLERERPRDCAIA